MGLIYKVTSPSGKMYIGRTTGKLQRRKANIYAKHLTNIVMHIIQNLRQLSVSIETNLNGKSLRIISLEIH